ncbi:magnesium transporter [Oharaeibacter diazotrophicus]|uniref:Magnesium transporter MgtE n=1 Tax=Oharaeibacter diazotrophicus TaxID=1920512 RepID=A0A4R6RJN4_9HYPH|nr:magnesium transporter [Oharaeibacter diazotrophicus]TDP86632.1 magnesium transporter [Oharaeibacter diazotrophicus]BBE71426.1 magnesium transporter MgtE [Pleomorphomonas sp. SM30]GLS78185.1 magnesium transporter MgtE [Oharaeibacter diazotrophicus]
MTEDGHAAPADDDVAAIPLRDDEGDLNPAFVEMLEAAVEAADRDRVRALAGDLHEADVGDLLDALAPDLRTPLVELLGDDFDFTALTEVDETVRVQIIEELPTATVVEGLRDMESDDAVYLLEDLDEADKAEILAGLPFPDRIALQRSLDYPEETAGRRMQTDFIAVPPFWTVGQTIDYLRDHDDLPEEFYEIFVIDPGFRLLGSVPLNRLLRARRTTRIDGVMAETRHLVRATDDQEEVARQFERYNLVSAAVTDDADRLVGVITVDDIVDVIQAEAEEDIRAMAGVGDEEISDSVVYTVKTRSVWLLVNLATAFLASSVIGLFEASIEKLVALAVLMPIVASMGGNAGTQTMTVAVRALATRELDANNAGRLALREIAVGLVNGVGFAILVGGIAGLWFRDPTLGMVFGAAMIVNMLAAAAAGIAIPLTLDRFDVDPAVASGVFVTTVTDCVGFLAFLGLATWILVS